MEGQSKESFKLRRLELCKACPQSQYAFGVGLTCGPFVRPVEGVSCGCKLTWKTSLANQECPQGIWGKIEKTKDEELVSKTT
tara:strand:- start:47 stop:292 length:246 start_codon:yes stop_codon:yes gene_type:complete